MKEIILLTNDDGYHAPGITSLRAAAQNQWDTVHMVAPDRERSAASHALTLNRPLRANCVDDYGYTVDGTPTDCVMLAIKRLLDESPSIVISGINSGANLGDDVLYSGTVAAAAEAIVLGIPAVASSMVDPDNTDAEWCARMTVAIAAKVLERPLPKGVFLNVNFPSEWTGGNIEVTTLGSRSYRDVVTENTDPRGKPYYWIGGQVAGWEGGDECDFAAIGRGNISITPLHLDMTAHHEFDELKTWSFT